jgi:SAM-dependent methyltransferase
VLDVACGPGNLSARLARLVLPGGAVVGIDLAMGMIELARAVGMPNARFEVMDMEQLAFGDASFDGAVCGHGLQFSGDLGQALREVHRVLKPGGTFVASLPVAPVKDSVWRLLDGTVDRWLPPPPEVVDQRATREVIGDASALKAAALAAGFDSATVEVVVEEVHWNSPQQLVSSFMGWWDCAARMESVEPERREGLRAEALATLKAHHPGAIESVGHNHVLQATT